MALQSRKTELVGDESLEEWQYIASGGFGKVYKARHKKLGVDVAIKLIQPAHGSVKSMDRALFDEANHMDKASFEGVVRLYAIYQGCPPMEEPSMQQGIVMEFMGGGSIQTLQRDLPGRPPWPLAFRWAHQVAVGMNFLHSKELLHQDLKPGNVLLDDDLNAKVADFGLSMVSTSALTSNTGATGDVGGSFKYMPPESFDLTYKPVRAFDRYSYGILLWSIVTGEEPYPEAEVRRVKLLIPKGQRPDMKKIIPGEAEGLKELVDLMEKCWSEHPSERPTFEKCLQVTESVFKKHKRDIPRAVCEVLTKLDPSQSNQCFTKSEASSYTPQIQESHDTVDHARFGVQHELSQQNPVSVPEENLTVAEKAKFVKEKKGHLIASVTEVMAIVEDLGDMVHDEAYSVIRATLTSQEKMRELYNRTFRPGGDKVRAAFYDALKKHHPNLVERPGG